jgi:hypothetical protein
MNLSFSEYYKKEFKLDEKSFRLYHEWLYDQMFQNIEVKPPLAKLIKTAIFKASWHTLWAGEFNKIAYEREVLSRAKIPSGELRGKVISELPSERELIPLLIPWTKCSNEVVAKAAHHKIDSIKLHTDGNN